MLQFGRQNNFMAWKLERINVCCKEFGFLANVLKTNEPYVPAAVQPADYMPAPQPEGEDPLPALGAAAIAGLRLDSEKQRNKVIAKLKIEAPKLYATLWETLSLESIEEIRQHEDYLEADLGQDPNMLWTIIVETHVTAIHGAGPEMRELEIVTLKAKLNTIRQRPNTSIAEFKKDFDDQIEIITGAGVDPPPQPELAMLFLTKLDLSRYGPMMAHLTNDATLGRPFPQTLHAAWTIASGWKGSTFRAHNGGEMHSVFTLADEERDSRGQGRGKGRGKAGNKQPEKGPMPPNQKTYPTTETRTCRGCLVKGHLYKHCPDNLNKETALVALEDPDAADYDAEYDAAFICINGQEKAIVLFTSTDVLIDNQASRSIFCNADLLTEITDSTPFYIGGIDASSKGMLVNKRGCFEGYGHVALQPNAAANVISVAEALNRGYSIVYSSPDDMYTLGVGKLEYNFSRKTVHGKKSSHYTCAMTGQTALVTTVADNMRNYTKREVSQARTARELMLSLAHTSSAAMIDMLDAGILNCTVTKTDVRNADAIFGPSIPSLKGKTTKRPSVISPHVLAPRVTQVEQVLAVDIFFVKKLPFLLGVLIPLGLSLCLPLKSRSAECVASALTNFLATASSRGFDCIVIKSDGEGAIANMAPALNTKGIVVDTAGPGQHVPIVERKIQTIKQRVRSYENSLPFIMTKLLLIMCVLFCISRLNMHPSRTSRVRVSPLEEFSGRKIDASRDLRVNFGDNVHATVPDPNSSMAPQTQGCIALIPTGISTGSVKMWCLATNHTVTRDQFTILPTPDLVITHIDSIATSEGYSRGKDPINGPLETDPRDLDDLSPLPTMMALPKDSGDVIHLADNTSIVSDEGVNEPSAAIAALPPTASTITTENTATENLNDTRVEIDTAAETLLELARGRNSPEGTEEIALTMSVKTALRDRKEEATSVMKAELTQMKTKNVWHGVKTRNLTVPQRRAIIRSSMFLKDKYLASGTFDKFKARLVAGGNQQDKSLYENLSSPTAALTSVFTIAAIAAQEKRSRVVIDIGGAFLNADMAPTGVDVHMRLNKVMTQMLVEIDESNREFVDHDGTMVVQLDKALYGCVEASNLWYNDLSGKLISNGFMNNPYDNCVFNKVEQDGAQTTVAVHVDDLFVTSAKESNLKAFCSYLKSVYPETKENRGDVIDYIGMTFDFTKDGEVSVTMDNCINDILSSSGVAKITSSPATKALFDVRDEKKLSQQDAQFFHTHVAKTLYLAKRVKPECLAAVAFLSTRVTMSDSDDMSKLMRLLGYILGTRDTGITFKIGDTMSINVFIDAAYGVHSDSGKSHTGCAIVLGEGGPLYAKSCKQKIVKKSSTEAELVGLSDTASQAIHTRQFLIAQGYRMGPATIYQDNKSCMALMKRGGPGSERSRHIDIKYFWLAERVKNGEVVIEHLGTEKMFANILTKPVHGAQFAKEKRGLTNWTRSI